MTVEQFRKITELKSWSSFALSLLDEQELSMEAIESFGTYWIEGGHHMREQIANDQLLIHLLRRILLPYDGGPIVLFRGENRGRWDNRSIGLAWTSNIETARMFGRGLNAVRFGGVLLKACFQPEAIISGPNGHSRYLDEDQFTVDPSCFPSITPIEFFPRIE